MITPRLMDLPSQTGIIAMTNAEYHADRTAVSSTQLKVMSKRTPAHFQQYFKEKRNATPSMEFGSAVHTALLEPERFAQEYVVSINVDRRTKDGKEQAAAFEAANAGKTIISADDYDDIRKMVRLLRDRSEVEILLDDSDVEVSMFWEDPDTRVLCKCRPDALGTLAISDLKTTDDASPEEFIWTARKYGYDLSAAFYVDGVKAVTGVELPFVFIVVEKTAPYGVALYEAPEEMLNSGRAKYKAALAKIAECRRTGIWHGYQPNGLIEKLVWPRWA